MKLGIFLTIVGGLITLAWLSAYIYGGDTLSAGIVEFLVGAPCLFFGIDRLWKGKGKIKVTGVFLVVVGGLVVATNIFAYTYYTVKTGDFNLPILMTLIPVMGIVAGLPTFFGIKRIKRAREA